MHYRNFEITQDRHMWMLEPDALRGCWTICSSGGLLDDTLVVAMGGVRGGRPRSTTRPGRDSLEQLLLGAGRRRRQFGAAAAVGSVGRGGPSIRSKRPVKARRSLHGPSSTGSASRAPASWALEIAPGRRGHRGAALTMPQHRTPNAQYQTPNYRGPAMAMFSMELFVNRERRTDTAG